MIHLPVIHRQRQGISQTDMAQRLGVSRRWLIEFEHARVPNPDFSQPLQLVARMLRFTDPITGEKREFVSRVPLKI